MVRFGDYTSCIRFDTCDDLLAGFKSILRGWTVDEVTHSADAPPIISFSRKDGRFRWKSKKLPHPDDWKRKGPRSVMDGVADFHYRFLDWHALEYRSHFCLHCAAVEVGDGLIIFPSVKKAGKSTLVMEMALRGYKVYCDDVLPVELGKTDGFAMGILPRLRLPLPKSLSPDHLEFVRSRMGLSDKYAAYINLRASELADFGETSPIHAVVLLGRSGDPVPARFSDVGKAEALARMIDQNYATHMSPTVIFDEMLKLVSNVELTSLEFFDVRDAADLIEQAFGG